MPFVLRHTNRFADVSYEGVSYKGVSYEVDEDIKKQLSDHYYNINSIQGRQITLAAKLHIELIGFSFGLV